MEGRTQYIGFALNEAVYSIPIINVLEILKTPDITRIPQSPSYVEGIANVRGNIISIINMKRLIHMDEAWKPSAHLIVLSSGKTTFGILADEITGVTGVEDSGAVFDEYPDKQTVNVFRVSAGGHSIVLDPLELLPGGDLDVPGGIDEGQMFEEKVDGNGKFPSAVFEPRGNEMQGARDFFDSMGIGPEDPRYLIFDDIVNFMKSLAERDYERADHSLKNILKKGQNDLSAEVGRIAKKLHDSLSSFRDSLDPRFTELATVDMPEAVDRLETVLRKTEEAADKTLGIVEKHITNMPKLAAHVGKLEEPADACEYVRNFRTEFEKDITEILTTQSFQDITGQILQKVIRLVRDIEGELLKLISDFGLQPCERAGAKEIAAEKVSQSDVEDLLKEFRL